MGCSSSKEAGASAPERVNIVFHDGEDRTAWRSTTLVRPNPDQQGRYTIRVDNSTNKLKVDLRSPRGGDLPTDSFAPLSARLASGETLEAHVGQVFNHAVRTRLLVLHEDELQDAAVVSKRRASTYRLELTSGRQVQLELNGFNHCAQRFDDAAAYEAALTAYCSRRVDEFKEVEDAITGNTLDLHSQTIYITMDAGENATGTGFSGVQRRDYRTVRQIGDLVDLLLKPSPRRAQGTHENQDVLIRADPGTGKTWSIRQLMLMLVEKVLAQAGSEPVRLVPIMIPVQRLAVLMRKATADELRDDMLRFYIKKQYQGDEQKLLLQADSLNALIPLIDGVDEAADLKQQVEDFVVKILAPSGMRTVITSRPEGVRLELYKKFVIMNLKPLTDEQQTKLIRLQISGNPKEQEVFHNLSRAQTIRQDYDRMYERDFTAEDRETIETIKPINLFKRADGSKDPDMRQRTRDGQSFIKVSRGEPQSAYVQELCGFFTASMLASLDAIVERLPESKKAVQAALAELTIPKEKQSVAERLVLFALKNARCDLPKELKKCKHERQARQVEASCRCKTASALWRHIVERTDLLYLATEDLLPVFKKAMHALVKRLGADASSVTLDLAPVLKVNLPFPLHILPNHRSDIPDEPS